MALGFSRVLQPLNSVGELPRVLLSCGGRWERCQALSFLTGMPTALCSYASAVTKTGLWDFSCSVPRLGALKSILRVLFLSSVSLCCVKEDAKVFHLLCCIRENTKVF